MVVFIWYTTDFPASRASFTTLPPVISSTESRPSMMASLAESVAL